MGVIEFFIIVIVVVAAAAGTSWVISTFFKNAPAVIHKVVWAVAVIVIFVVLATALGLTHYDPQIPRLR